MKIFHVKWTNSQLKKYNTENIFSICDKETNRNYIFYNTSQVFHPSSILNSVQDLTIHQ